MAYSETRKVEQITFDGYWSMYVLEIVSVYQDGVLVTQGNHRSSYRPGQDLSGCPQEAVEMATAAWTPERVQAFEDMLAATQPTGGE